VNAPFEDIQSQTLMSIDPVSQFLKRLSVEITPKQAEKIPLLAGTLAPGTCVYIALIDPAEVALQKDAAVAVRKAGLEPVPHVPARFVRDEADLKGRIAALAGDAGVRQLLVLGGGAPVPIGRYDAAIQLMETGVFQENGIRKIGIAGHPEGNPDITKHLGEDALVKALQDKQAWLKANGIEGYLATQFLFEAEPVAQWSRALAGAGITMPIHVGVPGPATIKTLVKYAAMCGVGNSARFIRKQAMNVTKLLSVSTPDEFVQGLARLHLEQPQLNIAGPHLYPFGGFDKLLDWLRPKLG
jgi:methylenetetrahydrofolate reductase (NADPH)